MLMLNSAFLASTVLCMDIDMKLLQLLCHIIPALQPRAVQNTLGNWVVPYCNPESHYLMSWVFFVEHIRR